MQSDFQSSVFRDPEFTKQDEELSEILRKLEGNLNVEEFSKEQFRRILVLLEVYNVSTEFGRERERRYSAWKWMPSSER